MELKIRRRREKETLEDLHVDIRRLAVLTFPTMEYSERERISCEYFVDALNDPDLILRVGERDPKSLDEALRIAQKLELWIQEVAENATGYITEGRVQESLQRDKGCDR